MRSSRGGTKRFGASSRSSEADERLERFNQSQKTTMRSSLDSSSSSSSLSSSGDDQPPVEQLSEAEIQQKEEEKLNKDLERAKEKWNKTQQEHSQAIHRVLSRSLDADSSSHSHHHDHGNGHGKKETEEEEDAEVFSETPKRKKLEEMCIICIEKIVKTHPVWQCDRCFVLLHFGCAQAWSRSSMCLRFDEDSSKIPDDATSWQCPKCRADYPKTEIPTIYKCFCGAQKNPQPDPWLPPHTCGQQCKKPLQPLCGHRCTSLCHIGACSPCPQTVNASCFCSKETRMVRCTQRKFSCNKVCGKPLPCKEDHFCKKPCHPGACDPCGETQIQTCLCGSDRSEVSCFSLYRMHYQDESGQDWEVKGPEILSIFQIVNQNEKIEVLFTIDPFRCEKVCGQPLSCSIHSCSLVCHKAGECPPCPNFGKRTCFCGAEAIEGLTCDKPSKSCGDTCNKVLDCGKHKCVDRCHAGDCSSCKNRVSKRCRCKKAKKLGLCTEEIKCDTKCKKPLSCGRHNCVKACCIGCTPCQKICDRNLNCGFHKCQMLCHSGSCFPCAVTVDIKCACGTNVINVPCAVQKTTPIPDCNVLCRHPSLCHHPSQKNHKCHYGECPPCPQTCNVKHAGCEHKCPKPCHDPVEPVRIHKKTKLPMGFPPPVAVSNVVCPPCVVPVKRQCLGQHEVRIFDCHKPRTFKCHRECGNMLLCTNHTCALPCHPVSLPRDQRRSLFHIEQDAGTLFLPISSRSYDLDPDILLGGGSTPSSSSSSSSSGEQVDNCRQCTRDCTKKQKCEHDCPLKCHPGSCPKCERLVKKRCHCPSKISVFLTCPQTFLPPAELGALMSCKKPCLREMKCGHKCSTICHIGECPETLTCTQTAKLRCKCSRILQEVRCDEYRNKYGGEVAFHAFFLPCDGECEIWQAEQKRLRDLKKEEEELRRRQRYIEENAISVKSGKKKKRVVQEQVVVKKSGPSFIEKAQKAVTDFVTGPYLVLTIILVAILTMITLMIIKSLRL